MVFLTKNFEENVKNSAFFDKLAGICVPLECFMLKNSGGKRGSVFFVDVVQNILHCSVFCHISYHNMSDTFIELLTYQKVT